MRLGRRFVVEAAVAASVTLLWSFVLLSGFGGERLAQATSNFGLSIAALSAGICCYARGRRSEGRAGKAWKLLGASALSWGCGQLAWTWYESVLGREVPFPSGADIGYLAAVPLAATALLALPAAPRQLATRMRTVLDGLMIAGSLLLMSWVLLLGPLVRTGSGSMVSQAISLAYPIGDVVVVTIVFYVMLRTRRRDASIDMPLPLVGAALVAIAVADSGFAYLTLIEAYSSGAFIDIGWFLGYVLLLLAARKPVMAAIDVTDDQEEKPFGLMVPYVAVLSAAAITSIAQLRGVTIDAVTSWARTMIIAFMVARQWLTIRENLFLTKNLESRVAERTSDLQASEQRFKALVQHSSDVVSLVDLDAVVLYQSESVTRVFGYEPEELVGMTMTELLDPSSGLVLLETLEQAAAEALAVKVIELSFRHRDGHMCTAEVTVTNLLDDPAVEGLVLNTRDISERKTLEDQLVHQAFHDSLTALANRALFRNRVEHALTRAEQSEPTVAVLFLDLDGFKEVNDSLGHASGDLLLSQLAERLRECVRPGDTVARLGGDEFAVLVEDVTMDFDIDALAQRITAAVRESFVVDGQEIVISGSVGIAVSGDDVENADQLLRNADLAMYRAKSEGEGGFEQYDPEMHTDVVTRLQLASDLRQALDNDEFEIHYQPTLALSSGEVVAVEALLRWRHPVRGMIGPNDFIPLAEKSGLIRAIGRWVLHCACLQAARWHREHPDRRPLTVSINISGRQLQSPSLVDDVASALAESGVDPTMIVLEITESVIMEDTEENLERLKRLKEMRVRLAIDDFGTGYSSLSYLQRFPVDILKIDRCFVERLGEGDGDDGLVATIVRLGHSLGMETVAEGIEDHAQFLALRRVGSELGQGFYFFRPTTVDQIDQLLDETEPARLVDWSPTASA